MADDETDVESHVDSETSSHDDMSTHDDASETPRCPPTPWWQDHPDIKALRDRVAAEFGGGPDGDGDIGDVGDVDDVGDIGDVGNVGDVRECGASSIADTSTHDDTSGTPVTRPKPWWQDHPEIKAMVASSNADIERRPERPPIDHPDAILRDVLSGTSVRELRDAKDDLARAKSRYDEAVCTARRLGLSWGRIGSVLGVSRQQLHRRYHRAVD